MDEVNWDQEVKSRYEGAAKQPPRALERQRTRFSTVSGDELRESSFDTHAPPFGITFLEPQRGVRSVGFIVWINGRGALVDPPPYTTQVLKHLQVS